MARRKQHARSSASITELAFLIPIVVSQRAARAARTRSASANAREASRMVTEKVGAATESMFAIAMSVARAQMEFASLWTRAACMPGAASIAALMQSSTADLSANAIAPFLRRTRSNARRLAR